MHNLINSVNSHGLPFHVAMPAHHLNLFAILALVQDLKDREVMKQPLLYCHFAQMGEEALYAAVSDWTSLRSILTDALESYNELNAAMNLVLFEDAMQHV